MHWTKRVHEHPGQREEPHRRRRATQTSCTFATDAITFKEVSGHTGRSGSATGRKAMAPGGRDAGLVRLNK
ncbi:hypothetical protein MDA_GLEAN10006745 [Myotis davidii]|uniref:Uncharacterized protein n=1 Tax=Myotis davidii TaxID=225400 RepID=L5LL27_MYODS|nr:hypothetical protein MDA_GLEAN10006745 [Myotis davidii]